MQLHSINFQDWFRLAQVAVPKYLFGTESYSLIALLLSESSFKITDQMHRQAKFATGLCECIYKYRIFSNERPGRSFKNWRFLVDVYFKIPKTVKTEYENIHFLLTQKTFISGYQSFIYCYTTVL